MVDDRGREQLLSVRRSARSVATPRLTYRVVRSAKLLVKTEEAGLGTPRVRVEAVESGLLDLDRLGGRHRNQLITYQYVSLLRLRLLGLLLDPVDSVDVVAVESVDGVVERSLTERPLSEPW